MQALDWLASQLAWERRLFELRDDDRLPLRAAERDAAPKARPKAA